ncbi:DUF4136 domain-containing protein [Microbulbifer thermotolerans]|uniref:DUF4136 domain-containing protein n=1 Tax=Microbulbifer thermotolerans TaxID=252514 RepID=A0A143HP52_MICTH|nr:DUF4136 domain-containing protein [Microbulbifer thermotolerans]AMX03515.1 hypothetical protein A3224_13875 [Microbulbifer thermotolerans]MCX2782229.1 DUF4136 domain-containing protein [Microbulbifer thermotolerans]MCX2795321.1 DUF4136 domain-containing protein [Microbulbifer thermotolerans]MCX2801117.1 DUF4136 domain-containing protein [Microbulbifer thermotolerans]MCX2831266.1 DUF4136 domain-containing protein [Microbulbifer thermotolerans]
MSAILRSTFLLRSGILALVVLLASCASAPPVAVDYDPQADFSNLHSYYLLDPLATGPVSPLEIKRMKRAADDILRQRYMAADNAESADFLVRVQLHSVDKVAVYDDTLAFYGGYRYWGFGWRAPLHVREYRENTLVMDVLSPDNSPLWSGSLRSTAARYDDPVQRQQQLREEMAQLLGRFPPN